MSIDNRKATTAKCGLNNEHWTRPTVKTLVGRIDLSKFFSVSGKTVAVTGKIVLWENLVVQRARPGSALVPHDTRVLSPIHVRRL